MYSCGLLKAVDDGDDDVFYAISQKSVTEGISRSDRRI